MNEHIEVPLSTEEIASRPSWINSDRITAKQAAHRMRDEYTGKLKGWGIPGFYEFSGTPHQVWIPVRRTVLWDKEREELEAITDDSLNSEPFEQFYKHIDMLISYDNAHIEHHMTVFPTTPIIEKHISAIYDRCKKDTKSFASEVVSGDQTHFIELDVYLRLAACLEQCLTDPTFRLSKEMVEDLYQTALTGDLPSSILVQYAQLYDDRNRMYGESVEIAGRFKEFIAEKLLDPSPDNKQEVTLYLNWAFVYPHVRTDTLTYTLLRAKSPLEIQNTVNTLGPIIGINNMRQYLREYVQSNPDFKPTFNQVFAYLGIDQGEEIAIDLGKDVYAKVEIDMDKEYEPYNETLPFELDLLKSVVKENMKVLDVGCGKGRVMIPLSQDLPEGVELSGFDLLQSDIEGVMEAHPEMDVRVGSWFNIPYANQEVDIAYCLGRSFTHNITIPDAVSCLKEMRRVIKNKGFIILDLPDPEVGEYKENIEKAKKKIEENGMKNVLPGIFNDSPDLKHYFDRYAPSDRAFAALCGLAGLKAIKIKESVPFKGASGVENRNNYWAITKFSLPRPNEQLGLLHEVNGDERFFIDFPGDSWNVSLSSLEEKIKSETKYFL